MEEKRESIALKVKNAMLDSIKRVQSGENTLLFWQQDFIRNKVYNPSRKKDYEPLNTALLLWQIGSLPLKKEGSAKSLVVNSFKGWQSMFSKPEAKVGDGTSPHIKAGTKASQIIGRTLWYFPAEDLKEDKKAELNELVKKYRYATDEKREEVFEPFLASGELVPRWIAVGFDVFSLSDVVNLNDKYREKLEENSKPYVLTYEDVDEKKEEKAINIIKLYLKERGIGYEESGAVNCPVFLHKEKEGKIVMPPRSNYKRASSFIHDLAHESIHSTQLELERKTKTTARAAEELVAEFGACEFLTYVGLQNTYQEARSSKYLDSWQEHLYIASEQKVLKQLTKSFQALAALTQPYERTLKKEDRVFKSEDKVEKSKSATQRS